MKVARSVRKIKMKLLVWGEANKSINKTLYRTGGISTYKVRFFRIKALFWIKAQQRWNFINWYVRNHRFCATLRYKILNYISLLTILYSKHFPVCFTHLAKVWFLSNGSFQDNFSGLSFPCKGSFTLFWNFFNYYRAK